jgi:hypothetical protein
MVYSLQGGFVVLKGTQLRLELKPARDTKDSGMCASREIADHTL